MLSEKTEASTVPDEGSSDYYSSSCSDDSETDEEFERECLRLQSEIVQGRNLRNHMGAQLQAFSAENHAGESTTLSTVDSRINGATDITPALDDDKAA